MAYGDHTVGATNRSTSDMPQTLAGLLFGTEMARLNFLDLKLKYGPQPDAVVMLESTLQKLKQDLPPAPPNTTPLAPVPGLFGIAIHTAETPEERHNLFKALREQGLNAWEIVEAGERSPQAGN